LTTLYQPSTFILVIYVAENNGVVVRRKRRTSRILAPGFSFYTDRTCPAYKSASCTL